MPNTRRPIVALTALAAATALLLTACGSSGASAPASSSSDSGSTAVTTSGSTGAACGGEVTVLAQGDAGAMVNQLLLTASNPLGDAVFGIDNTFASRALSAGILAPYTSPADSTGAGTFSTGADR